MELQVFGQSKAKKKSVKTGKDRAARRFLSCILRCADVSPDAGTDQPLGRFSTSPSSCGCLGVLCPLSVSFCPLLYGLLRQTCSEVFFTPLKRILAQAAMVGMVGKGGAADAMTAF